jgi:hypothetical protein
MIELIILAQLPLGYCLTHYNSPVCQHERRIEELEQRQRRDRVVVPPPPKVPQIQPFGNSSDWTPMRPF